jgi:hypothetical protein
MRAIVIAGLNGIAPRDEMEGMIAAQMLACHDAAMGCFREALNSNLYGRLAHPRAPLPETGQFLLVSRRDWSILISII